MTIRVNNKLIRLPSLTYQSTMNTGPRSPQNGPGESALESSRQQQLMKFKKRLLEKPWMRMFTSMNQGMILAPQSIKIIKLEGIRILIVDAMQLSGRRPDTLFTRQLD